MTDLVLATRGSDLARTQSLGVARALEERCGLRCELLIVRTEGDRNQEVALGDAGAIGLFTSEVQQALLDGRAHLAVHSLKDLPAQQVEGLQVGAVPPREDPRDLLIVRPEAWFADEHPLLPLPPRARVGTASARRRALAYAHRSDLEVGLLRGNVPTRVQKLRDNEHDAILLAAAGVRRLGLSLEGLEVVELPLEAWPCAPGQGALAVECRADDARTLEALAALHDPETARCIDAERGLLRALGGGCALPLGAYACDQDGTLVMHAALGATEDSEAADTLLRASVRGASPEEVAAAACADLRRAQEERRA